MAHGGKRAGAGRPLGPHDDTLRKIEGRRIVRELVLAHLKPLVEAQLANAKGTNYAVVRHADGTFRRIDSAEEFDRAAAAGDPITIHTQQPNVTAFSDLMNRALDKPVEPHEVEHSGGIDVCWKGKR